MKLLTLRVADFRGIASCEVAFSPRGVTILEGPNEAGKSSLALALDFLLDKPDSTRSQEVKAAQPAGRDVGPEVEITAESGAYAFRYRKRFLKRPQTELAITRPAPETLTGREAHDRVRAILEETMDLDLWTALRIEQGTGVRQPNLDGVPSLMEALERAAGGDTDPEDDGLLERATAEYLSFFTEKRGQETKRIKEARTALAEAVEEAAARQRDHDELERDADRRQELERAAATLREERAAAARDRTAAQTAVKEIETLRHAVEKLEPAAQEVRTRLKQVQKEHQERLDLAEARDRAAARRAELARAGAGLVEAADAAARRLTEAEQLYQQSRRALAEAEAALETRAADEVFRREEAELAALRSRREDVDRAERALAEARGALTGNPVDDDLLRRLEEAALAVEARRAALEAGAPTVEVEALDAVTLDLDGEPVPLEKGETRHRSVPMRLDLTLPDRLRVTVEAGGSAADRRRDFEAARHDLGRLLAEAAVDTPDAARARHRERRAAADAVAGAESRRRDLLAGRTPEELESRAAVLAERVGVYFANRAPEPPIAADGEAAERAREEAAAAGRALREETARRETERESRRVAEAAAREALTGHESGQKEADRARLEAETRLAALRETKGDDALSAELSAVKKEQVEREQAFYDRRRELENKQPERAQATLEAATGRVEEAERKLREADRELDVLGERLRLRGEEGLFDRLEAARQREAVARRAEASLTRRAEAARLLYETLVEERETARRRYRSPLRAEIESLGREIFGETFEVELDDDLRVTRRVVDGTALPLESLSMGAREQLSVITRLACARLVSDTGGIPLILDDALGYSDPDRLTAMARVLETAGADAQIIVLTCFGDRYARIRGAATVHLG